MALAVVVGDSLCIRKRKAVDRRTSDALLTILETVTDMDRRPASRLLEAFTLLVVLAPAAYPQKLLIAA